MADGIFSPDYTSAYFRRKKNRLAAYPRGTLTFNANPTSGNTITLGGTVVSLTPYIASTTNKTLTALLAFLNNSLDLGIAQIQRNGAYYTLSGSVLSVWGNDLASVGMGVSASGGSVTVVLPTNAQATTRQRIPL